jgi:hypothetical protein
MILNIDSIIIQKIKQSIVIMISKAQVSENAKKSYYYWVRDHIKMRVE